MIPKFCPVSFRARAWALFALVIGLFAPVLAHAEPAHRVLLREAGVAMQAEDLPGAIVKLEQAEALRPDYPRVLLNLARLYAQTERADEALGALRKLAGMGLVFGIERDGAYDPIRARPEFAALVSEFAANAAKTIGDDRHAWGIDGVTGIIESIATHPASGDVFFGDVRNRCIWVRDAGGALKKFSAESDGLFGVFALKFSTDGKTLWAASSALPEMAGFTDADKGRALLAQYDLTTRTLTRTHPLPVDGRDHVLGDFAIAPDGTIYATDSIAPVIWRLPVGGTLEPWLESDDFVSLQGTTLSADGASLFVADYANGIWRIDVATRKPTLLPVPEGATFFGIDGIYGVPGGLVAVQNGVNPQRILKIDLGESGTVTSASVLAANHPSMSGLGLGEIVVGHFQFVADSGWELFGDPNANPPARAVTIQSVTY